MEKVVNKMECSTSNSSSSTKSSVITNIIANEDNREENNSAQVSYGDLKSDMMENDLTIRINVATCQGITVDKISSQVWRDAKQQIQRLLDQNLEQSEREQIAATLTDMCDRMETKNILETNIPQNVQLAIQLGAGSFSNEQAATISTASSSVESFNERLRERIAEFNHGLISLGDGITRLKNKLLTLEYCTSSSRADAIDVHVCRNIHKNFRRILQKESRFLRDELFAAKETIFRLERRSTSPTPPAESIIDQQNTSQHQQQLVPYHHPYEFTAVSATPFHPAAYFNVVEHVPQIWSGHNAPPSFMAYPAIWERMYTHPELSRQLQCYDNMCDPNIQCLPQQTLYNSSSNAHNAIAVQQSQCDPAWIHIGRSLQSDIQQPQEECDKDIKKKIDIGSDN